MKTLDEDKSEETNCRGESTGANEKATISDEIELTSDYDEMLMKIILEGRGWVQKKDEYKASSSKPSSA